jgi:hypothetical protein
LHVIGKLRNRGKRLKYSVTRKSIKDENIQSLTVRINETSIESPVSTRKNRKYTRYWETEPELSRRQASKK